MTEEILFPFESILQPNEFKRFGAFFSCIKINLYRANIYDKIGLNCNISLLTTFHYHPVCEGSEIRGFRRCAAIMNKLGWGEFSI